MHGEKHQGLRSWATALKVVAWLVLALGVIAAIGAIVGGQQAVEGPVAERAASAGVQVSESALAATGITGGIALFIMSVIWFLILYVLAEIGQAVQDIWDSRVAVGEVSRVSAADVSTSRTGISTEPGYNPTRGSHPPANAPG